MKQGIRTTNRRMKRMIWVIVAATTLLASCGEQHSESTPIGKEKKGFQVSENLIQPLHIASLFEDPTMAVYLWNQAVLDSLQLTKLSIVNQYGDHKEEKLAFLFSRKNRVQTFYRYKYKVAKSAESILEYKYNNFQLPVQVEFLRWMGQSNEPPLSIVHDSAKTVFIHYKSVSSNDSTFFYPSAAAPELIVHKVGDYIQRVEFLEEGNYTRKKVQELARSIDSSLEQIQHAQLIYTEFLDGLPVRSTEFSIDWEVLEEIKQWKYSRGLLESYQEFLHGKMIHSLEVEYDDQNLPIKAVFDRKRWDFYYTSNR